MKFNDVYVVDDDKIFHFIVKKLLLNNNIDVSPAYFFNGLEALRVAFITGDYSHFNKLTNHKEKKS